ncbi:DEMETER-like protein 2 [Dendrobium catenatum]|uniref:DEMETER-like protein 2 n=2 Tax=Dendrobium catenatum TaxID=906689 RepID=A0A2I0WS47_9ASPA|nr:DEMETER-like protein 2 [Dendrobium catenatum]
MSLAAKFPLHRRGEGGSSERKLDEEHEETFTDAMGFLDNIPGLSNCDAQDPMDIQLNGHPLEDLTSQSHYIQNSFVSSRMDSENAIVFDVDGCIPIHVAIISKAFRENAENECRDRLRALSGLVTCSNMNNYHVYKMDAEKEAIISPSSELEAHFRLEENTSNEKKANSVDEGKIDWEGLRRKVDLEGGKKERSRESLDSVDWEAVRNADANKISEAIRERGMNNLLANRIKDFLNRLFRDHGSIDLELLRNVCPDEAKLIPMLPA